MQGNSVSNSKETLIFLLWDSIVFLVTEMFTSLSLSLPLIDECSTANSIFVLYDQLIIWNSASYVIVMLKIEINLPDS